MIIPSPNNFQFNQWVEELCKQSQTIPYPMPDWQGWVYKLYQNTKFYYVSPDGYDSWQNWANNFLLTNQGYRNE
jgi:hypothetical protein